MLDTTRMFTLRAVAEHGSITAAASALGYTTSAVSQQIAKLEKEAGQPLLERHARGIVLTEAGRSVVKHTERILIELEAADAELAEIKGLRAGVLALGTFPTAGSSLLPLVVKEFKTRHPGVELKVLSGRFAYLVDALRRRETELSLLWDYEWNRVDDPHVDVPPRDERSDRAAGVGTAPSGRPRLDPDRRIARRIVGGPRRRSSGRADPRKTLSARWFHATHECLRARLR